MISAQICRMLTAPLPIFHLYRVYGTPWGSYKPTIESCEPYDCKLHCRKYLSLLLISSTPRNLIKHLVHFGFRRPFENNYLSTNTRSFNNCLETFKLVSRPRKANNTYRLYLLFNSLTTLNVFMPCNHDTQRPVSDWQQNTMKIENTTTSFRSKAAEILMPRQAALLRSTFLWSIKQRHVYIIWNSSRALSCCRNTPKRLQGR